MVGRRKVVLSDEQSAFLQDQALELKGRFGADVWHAFKRKFPDSTITKTTLQRRFEDISAQIGNRDEATSSNQLKQIFFSYVSIKCLSTFRIVSPAQEYVHV